MPPHRNRITWIDDDTMNLLQPGAQLKLGRALRRGRLQNELTLRFDQVAREGQDGGSRSCQLLRTSRLTIFAAGKR